jgi:hypothetical protein
MNKLQTILAGAVVLASAVPVIGKTVTVKGILLDMKCYTAMGMTSRKHGMTCGKSCLESGIPAGILVGKTAWTLATPPQPLAPYVGDKVKVTGTADAKDHVFIPTKIMYWSHKMSMWMKVK